jgi:hypothetical protein
MQILLAEFSSKVGREDFFKPAIGNESLQEISNDNGVTVVNFATSKISLSNVQCIYILIFINLVRHLLMESLTIKLTIF